MGSREGFGPMGDPGLMLGAPAQPGAGLSTGQSPRPEHGESRGTGFHMQEIELDDAFMKQYVDLDS
jgi:hypothetical protein